MPLRVRRLDVSLVVTAVMLVGASCKSPTRPSPEPCTYVLAPTSASFSAGSGSGTLSMTTANSCSWSASTTVSWVSLTSGTSGTGSGTIQYTVGANSGTASRSGAISAGGQSLSISQSGVSTYTLSGTVTDAFLGSPVAGASVVIASGPSSGSTSTSSNGRYVLSGLLPGAYVIQFSAPRFATGVASLSLVTDSVLNSALVLSTTSPPSISDLTGAWSGTGSYPNMPFKLELFQTGTALSGVYQDQHDGSSTVSGTYAAAGFILSVNFGDAFLTLECFIDSAQQIHGRMRSPSLNSNSPYPFTMTR
jgi:hypothetical protein